MADFVFEQGEAIITGLHGDHSYVYADGDPVPDTGLSSFVFESGVGIGGMITIDSFEDDDIAEYTGRTGDFNVNQTGAVDGNYYLHGEASYGANNQIVSMSGLDVYPSRGDLIRSNVRFATNSEAIMFDWACQGGSRGEDAYGIALKMETDELLLGRGKNQAPHGDTKIDVATVDFSPYEYEWLVCEIEWGDPTITVDLYETDGNGNPSGSAIATVSGDDGTYDSGGIGWVVDSVSSGSIGGDFDYARMA